jgi:hypothetical protein
MVVRKAVRYWGGGGVGGPTLCLGTRGKFESEEERGHRENQEAKVSSRRSRWPILTSQINSPSTDFEKGLGWTYILAMAEVATRLYAAYS